MTQLRKMVLEDLERRNYSQTTSQTYVDAIRRFAAHGKKRKMTLTAEEFLRRFLFQVLPKGLVRIRHYGWMANRCRCQRAALVRTLLAVETAEPAPSPSDDTPALRCPICGGVIEVVEMIVPREFGRRRLSRRRAPDTS